MDKQLNVLGHNISITPQTSALPAVMAQPTVTQKDIRKAVEILKKYKDGKANLESRIVENERWYKMRHWEAIRNQTRKTAKPAGDVEPASAWLFSALAAKHADAMDNYPEPNILPREEGDEIEAKNLSAIIPLVLDRCEFEQTYSDAWWYKLKNGTVPYGIFWDKGLENGLGDIRIRKIDLLNIFWEPGISDIQDSRNLFIVALQDDEALKAAYPQYKGGGAKTIDVKEYIYDDTVDTSTQSVVVDWYYKSKTQAGKAVLHMAKFVGDTPLYATENDPNLAQTGLYDHGLYPVVFDVLFPEEGMPTGFGYIDVMRDPQIYVDKLDQIIIKNALMAGKKRWFITEDANINEAEFADWSKDFVHVTGQSLEDRKIKEIEVNALDSFIATHRMNKIDEMKETSGNRDFSQGGTSGGVTAAAAIAALQESGNKGSRDMIKGSYRAYTKLINFSIELVRQFYDEPRSFRIIGDQAAAEYIQYQNAGIKPQKVQPYPNAAESFRLPIFDIKIKAQRANPFSRAAQNELAKELYGAGLFNPQLADQALIVLEMMEFEGKAKIVEKVAKNQQMQMMIQKLAAVVTKLTGIDPLVPQTAPTAAAPKGKSSAAQTSKRATDNANTSYGEKLAARATPDASKAGGTQ